MAEKIIFTQLTEAELRQIIREELKAFQSELFKTIETKVLHLNSVDKLLSRKETAKYLHTSLVSLDKWTRQGKITGYRIGGRVVYKKEDIERAMQKMSSPIIV